MLSMEKHRWLFCLLVALIIPISCFAQVLPTNEWMLFYSDSSTINGAPLPIGTKISVLTETGFLCGDFVVSHSGHYGFLPAYSDDPTSGLIEGARPDESLFFYVHGYSTLTSFNFPVWTSNGAVIDWDLHLNLPAGPRPVLDPICINFPSTIIGASATVLVNFTNMGDTPLRLRQRLSLPFGHFQATIDSLELQPDEAIQLPIVFAPCYGNGVVTGALTFTTNANPVYYTRMTLQGEIISDIIPAREWIMLSGTCMFNDQPAPRGTFIDVYDVSGRHCGSLKITNPGHYGPLLVYADDPMTPQDEGAEPGEFFHMRINGYPATGAGPDPNQFTAAGANLHIDLLAKSNFPPTINHHLVDVTLPEDSQPIVIAKLDTIFNDLDGDTLSFEIFSDTGILTASVNWHQQLLLSFGKDQYGSANVIVSANDGRATVADTFLVNILSINDAPEIINLPGDLVTLNTDTLRLDLNSSVRDVDSPGNCLSWSIASLSPHLTATIELNHIAVLFVTNYAGYTRALVTVSDDSGAQATDTLKVIFQPQSGIADRNLPRPESFYLSFNFPNPFNSETTIHYHLARASEVVVTVYDLCGREIIRWHHGFQPAGSHKLNMNLQNCTSGNYFYRLQANGIDWVRRMVLVK